MDEKSNQGVQTPKEPTKKEKAQQAGKDIAEVTAKGAANYFGGPIGGALANKMTQTRVGQKALNNVGKNLSRNPIARNTLAKSQPAIQQSKPMLNTAAGGLGGTSSRAKGTTDATTGANDLANSTGNSSSNPLSSKTDSNNSNNSGFGNNKSGLFSNFKSSPSGGNGSVTTDAVNIFKKAKKIIAIVSAIAPIALPICLAMIIGFWSVAQIMVIRDNIDKLVQKFTTGVEKYINFAQGDGWATNEEAFFTYLNDEYNNYKRLSSSGEDLDIPLIAATIHYSKFVDMEQYEKTEGKEDDNYSSDDFEQLGEILNEDQTVSFYRIAKGKLGSTTTLFPGQKRLLGHLSNVKVEVGFYNAEAAKQYWADFFNYALKIAADTGMDIKDETILNYAIDPISSFLKLYQEMQANLTLYGDITYGMRYDVANNVYELKEFLYKFKNLFNLSSAYQSTEGKNDAGFFLAPKIITSMNYGYDEYKQMKQDLIDIKKMLKEDNIAVNSNDDALSKAKASNNDKLNKLHESYKDNEKKYMYSYTHYLQKIYVPFTYFYNQSYTQQQIDIIVEDIYDQRDFYNYLVDEKEGVGSACEGSTQAGDLRSMTRDEYINFVGPIAQLDYSQTGILASITIAQSIQESNGGKETPPNSNNLFGIKCHNWGGKCISASTNEEYKPGEITNITDSFRVYDSVEASIRDHSNFLLENSNYNGITETTDYKEQAKIIKAGGYATDSDYAETIIAIIEQHDLTRWDTVVNASSNAFMCGPVTSGGWTIRTTTPTSTDRAFTYVSSNRGQCVWYAKARAIEIAEELSDTGKINKQQMEQIKKSLLNIYGNAEAWYRNGGNYFKTSKDKNNLKAGSIIVWGGGSTKCNPKCGHVAIVEEVTSTSVTITDGWATGGYSCPTSWGCVNFRTRTMSLEEYFASVPNNFGSYSGSMFFTGYVYFLEPL